MIDGFKYKDIKIMTKNKINGLKSKRLYFLIFSAVAVVLCVAVFFANPHNGHLNCLSQSLFNVYCSACGITRSLHYLLRLDILTAFYYNPFFVLSLPLFAFIYVSIFLKLFLNIDIIQKIRYKKTAAVVYLFAFLLFGILRNFGFFIFLPL